MKQIFIIGGMGSGKSTVRKTLEQQGVPAIDLDALGHEALACDSVKLQLKRAFGTSIFDACGCVNRAALAAIAFANSHNTCTLNAICMPQIEQLYACELHELQEQHQPYVAVEYSTFTTRNEPLAKNADVLIAVLASLEARMQRLQQAGWSERDIRARIVQQISDDQRKQQADVVFYNDGTPGKLAEQTVQWWRSYTRCTCANGNGVATNGNVSSRKSEANAATSEAQATVHCSNAFPSDTHQTPRSTCSHPFPGGKHQTPSGKR